ncbi:hypothetical protein BXZ70DRAFT_564876 [Cristinia sonorae]|uniref:Uncharacterized protein n=1 Tax=Cristinia sonorae TaxID=1940300 RepID=A0A8K0UHN6_9AGAR|nr:hypothetical protein BXZ70DRAFT_564876 [Cristinia sonorae]
MEPRPSLLPVLMNAQCTDLRKTYIRSFPFALLLCLELKGVGSMRMVDLCVRNRRVVIEFLPFSHEFNPGKHLRCKRVHQRQGGHNAQFATPLGRKAQDKSSPVGTESLHRYRSIHHLSTEQHYDTPHRSPQPIYTGPHCGSCLLDTNALQSIGISQPQTSTAGHVVMTTSKLRLDLASWPVVVIRRTIGSLGPFPGGSCSVSVFHDTVSIRVGMVVCRWQAARSPTLPFSRPSTFRL